MKLRSNKSFNELDCLYCLLNNKLKQYYLRKKKKKREKHLKF